MEKLTHCDKCGSKIVDGKCDCGKWFDYKDYPEHMNAFEKAILAYNFNVDQGKISGVMSADHHSGTSILIFPGDYDLCMKAKSYIQFLISEKNNNP